MQEIKRIETLPLSLRHTCTTPESVDLQRIFRQMKDEQVDVVIMEVSSHALDQKRVHGIQFQVGEFTNLTQDHLDYHNTFATYLAAKKQLFYQSDKAVVNIDDSHAQELLAGLDLPVMTFGIREQADITASEIDITTRGVQFDLHYRNITSRMNIPIPGLFSVFNAMGAAGVALSLGWSLDCLLYTSHGEPDRDLEPGTVASVAGKGPGRYGHRRPGLSGGVGHMTAPFHHIPIMVEPVLALLAPERGGIFVDGTLGGGGHAEAVLSRLPADGRLIGIDRDAAAIGAATQRLSAYGDRFIALKGNFFAMPALLASQGVQAVDGLLLDLGRCI